MIVDIFATIIILLATVVSVVGAICVSGITNAGRKKGFIYWQISNTFWIITFGLGLFGYISPVVFIIQQFCAGTTFIIYFICNYRGTKNNGDS